MNYFTLPTFLKKMPYKLPETGGNNWEILFKQDGILVITRRKRHKSHRVPQIDVPHPNAEAALFFPRGQIAFSAWNWAWAPNHKSRPYLNRPSMPPMLPIGPHHQEKNKRPKFECDHEKFEIKYDQINSRAFGF